MIAVLVIAAFYVGIVVCAIVWTSGWKHGNKHGRSAERKECIEQRAHSMLHRDERCLRVVRNDEDGAA